MVRSATIKAYYILAKPGIIYGNLITTIGGFLLASGGDVDRNLLAALLLGVALVIGSGCAFNNVIDRDIDIKMARTKNRPTVSGSISGRSALIYATVLSLAGFIVLTAWVHTLTAIVGLAGLFFYVIVYGYWKRRSPFGTIVGSISGATPPVAGYVAVTGAFDTGALLLFLIMACWQMPHFYAIAMYRYDDYAAAGVPVLPVKKGMQITRRYILGYIACFMILSLSLTVYDYTGYGYAGVMLLLCLGWLLKGLQGYKNDLERQWARGIFKFSLIVIIGWSIALSAGI